MAARLASVGWNVWIPDLYGTGDSDGTTEAVTLSVWRSDLRELARQVQHGEGHEADDTARHDSDQPFELPKLVLWGIRHGCMLAVDLLAQRSDVRDVLLLWQPGGRNAGLLKQQGKPMLRSGGTPLGPTSISSEVVSEQQANGLQVVNGYRYSRKLLEDLGELSNEPPSLLDHRGRPVGIIHMARNPAAATARHVRASSAISSSGFAQDPPASEPSAPRALEQLAVNWREVHSAVNMRLVAAEPFWSSIEPSLPTAAFDASEAFLAGL
jgi:hypothetical protein